MSLAQINESYKLRNERLDFIPENFKRGITSVSTASELDLKPISWGFSTAKTPLWRFLPHMELSFPQNRFPLRSAGGKLSSLLKMRTLVFMQQGSREMMLSMHFASN